MRIADDMQNASRMRSVRTRLQGGPALGPQDLGGHLGGDHGPAGNLKLRGESELSLTGESSPSSAVLGLIDDGIVPALVDSFLLSRNLNDYRSSEHNVEQL